MLDTFKVRLKAKLKAAGITLSNVRIDAIADRLNKQFPDLAEESDHDKKLEELDAIQPFKEIASFDDYQRAKAAKEKKDKEKQQQQTQTNGDSDDEDDDEGEEEEAKPAAKKKKRESETQKLLKQLLEKVSTIESEKKTVSIKEKIKGHEKMKEVPATFWDDDLIRLPEKEDDIESFVEKIVTKHNAFKQEENNEKGSKTTKPVNATAKTKEADPKKIEALVDDLMPNTKTKTVAA